MKKYSIYISRQEEKEEIKRFYYFKVLTVNCQKLLFANVLRT